MIRRVRIGRWISAIVYVFFSIIILGIHDSNAQNVRPVDIVEKSFRFQDGKAFGINFGLAEGPVTTLAIGNSNGGNAAPFTLITNSYVAMGIMTWLSPTAPFTLNVEESTFPPDFGPQVTLVPPDMEPPAMQPIQFNFRPEGDGFVAESTNGDSLSRSVEAFVSCEHPHRAEVETITLGGEREGSRVNCLVVQSGVRNEQVEPGITQFRDRFTLPLNPENHLLQFRLTQTSTPDLFDVMGGTNVGENSSTLSSLERPTRDGDVIIDIDLFRIKIPSNGTLTVNTIGFTDTFARLLDVAGQIITSDDDSGNRSNFQISQQLSAGTYLVQIEATSLEPIVDNAGSYIFQSSFVPEGVMSLNAQTESIVADSSRISRQLGIANESVPQQFPDAIPVNPGESLEASFDTPGEIDVYQVVLPSDGLVSIGGFSDFSIGIPDLEISQIVNGQVVVVETVSFYLNTISSFLPAGTYFIEAQASPSDAIFPYTFEFLFEEATFNMEAVPEFDVLPTLEDHNLRVNTDTELLAGFGGFGQGGPRCISRIGFSPEICSRGVVTMGANSLPEQLEIIIAAFEGTGEYILEVFSSPISPVNTAACTSNVISETEPDAPIAPSDAQNVDEIIEAENCLRITGSNDDIQNEPDNDAYIVNISETAATVTFSLTPMNSANELRLQILLPNGVGQLDICEFSFVTNSAECVIALPANIRQLVARVYSRSDNVGEYHLDILPSNLLEFPEPPIPVPADTPKL